MKRIAPLVLAAVMSLGSFGAAEAVEIKAKGTFDFGFGFVDGTDFHKESGQDIFHAGQRFRTQIDIIASEALKGVLFFEIGQIDWGRDNSKLGKTGNGSGGSLSADGVNIKTRRAYIDWMVPNTDLNFRIGLQGLVLPGGLASSPVMDDDVAAFVGNYKFNDKFALTAFWARPFDDYENDGWDKNIKDETDMFGLIAPITLDGFDITPWAMYSKIGLGGSGESLVSDQLHAPFKARNPKYDEFNGNNLDGKDGDAWWAGLSFEMNILDPIVFKFDAMYGSMKADDVFLNDATGDTGDFKMDGWFLDALVEYKAGWGVPGLFGWYASGMDSNDVRDGHYNLMPTISGGFCPTTFGFDGATNDISYDTVLSTTGVGMWGVGLQARDMSFIQDLTHTLRVVYMGGTNSKDSVRDLGSTHIFHSNDNQNPGGVPYLNLATNETAFEVNFDKNYQIYENLSMFTDIAWIRLDLDGDLRDKAVGKNGERDFLSKNAWKAMTGFRYSF